MNGILLAFAGMVLLAVSSADQLGRRDGHDDFPRTQGSFGRRDDYSRNQGGLGRRDGHDSFPRTQGNFGRRDGHDEFSRSQEGLGGQRYDDRNVRGRDYEYDRGIGIKGRGENSFGRGSYAGLRDYERNGGLRNDRFDSDRNVGRGNSFDNRRN